MTEREHVDTYFFDPRRALETARQNNRAKKVGLRFTGLQICYYNSEHPIKDAPKNCIHVPLENYYNYFVTTENRSPLKYDIKNSDINTKQEIDKFKSAIKEINEAIQLERTNLIELYKKECKKLTPDFSDKKLRVYFSVSSDTTVMQYITKSVENAFRKLGFETLIDIPGDMSAYFVLPKLVKYHEFNPHITFNVNYENNTYINDSVINIIWYQDPMPSLQDTKNLFLRDSDIIYTLTDRIMPKCLPHSSYSIQKTCVDSDVFYRDSAVKKENKILFIGSRYRHHASRRGMDQETYEKLYVKLREMLTNNLKITKKILSELSEENNIPLNSILFGPLSVVIREITVEWICTQKKIKVEVYGRFWETNKIVSPYFKGEVPFGKKLNKLYNSAKYALSSHPSVMHLTRVPEIAACGAIPVMYDARELDTNEYEYKDSSLIFSNYQELENCLSLEPQEPVSKIAEEMSYDKFVQKTVKRINEEIRKNEDTSTCE